MVKIKAFDGASQDGNQIKDGIGRMVTISPDWAGLAWGGLMIRASASAKD